jgi:proteasome lid subunit RPN8/RPN11
MALPIQILSVPKDIRDKFRIEANGSGGDEVCAVMTGKVNNFSGQIEEVRLIRNIAKDMEAGFVMDPKQFLEAVMDTDLYDSVFSTQYMGIIHSHYFDHAYPSIVDWEGAVGGLYHGPYLIYSVIHEEWNGFYWNGNEFLKMELIT